MDNTINPIFGPNLKWDNKLSVKEFDDFSIFNFKFQENSGDCVFKENSENFQKHETYKNLTIDSYSNKSDIWCEGWEKLDIVKNDETGFSASIYQNEKDNETVIAYRGTDDTYLDLKSGEDLFKNKLPAQFKDAKKLYETIKKKFPNSNIILTGHSLGGSLAQLVACEHSETKAFSFNALGVKNVIEENNLRDNKNIINYCVSSDILSNILPQTGEVRTVDKGEMPNKVSLKNFKFAKSTDENDGHDLRNFHDLENAQYLSEEQMKDKREELCRQTSAYKFILKNIPNVVDIATWFKNTIPQCMK